MSSLHPHEGIMLMPVYKGKFELIGEQALDLQCFVFPVRGPDGGKGLCVGHKPTGNKYQEKDQQSQHDAAS